MNVLSVCDGMSCAQIALHEMGIIPNIYYSSEIDKFAIAQTQLNFPNTIQLGDMSNIDVSKLEPIDFLSGGTPCTNFSFAGKRKGMATKCEIQITKLDQYLQLKAEDFQFEGQSYLFWEYMRILTDIRKYNPGVLFLLENVEMGSKWERILSEAIGIFGVHINSALVSAQNRKRIYWTNIKTKEVGMFGELYSDIPQPADRGILLRDILETDVDEKYFLSDKMINCLSNRPKTESYSPCEFNPIEAPFENKSRAINQRIAKMGDADNYLKIDIRGNKKPDQSKASCFTAGGHSGGNHSDMGLIVCHNLMPRSSTTGKGGTGPLSRNDGKTYCLDTGNTNAVEITPRQQANLRSGDEKANSFLSTSWKGSQANGMTLVSETKTGAIKYGRTDEAKEKRRQSMKKGRDFTPFAEKEINGIDYEKMHTLTQAVNKDNLLMQVNACDFRSDEGFRWRDDEKSPTLMARARQDKYGPPMTADTSRIRRLTPTECARLQTVPSWYKWECSDTQVYKMCGNGWTIQVIMHIFSFLPKHYFNQPIQ